MADRLNQIKKRVSAGNSEEDNSEMRGMQPSIVNQGEYAEGEYVEGEEGEYAEGEYVEGEEGEYAGGEVMPQTPSMGQQMNVPVQQYQPIQYDRFQELAESIINEKWDELVSSLGNITLWKERMQTDVMSMKQEILRLEERFENLQKSILGRVEDYNKTISDVGSDVKALEQVFEKILQPLTTNIKELNRITEDLKSIRKK